VPKRTILPLLAVFVGGCMGDIGDPPPAIPVVEVSPCVSAPSRGISFNRLRRLSSTELTNTLGTLLGADVIADTQLQAALTGLPRDKSLIAGDFVDDPPVALAQAIAQIAQRTATLGLASPAWRAAHLPACATTAPISDACAAQSIAMYGAQVFRRDLTDAEVADYVTFYSSMGAGEDGFAYTLRRLLQAPSMVFHVETGGDVSNGSIRLTDFEVASRIAYFVTNSMPDPELMNAARAGQLQTLDGVRAQITRLLATDTARAKVVDFFRYYTHLEEVPDPLQTQATRLGIADVTGLGAQMRAEAFEFFESVFWSGGSFAELMTSTSVYPRSTALAAIFGTAPVSSTAPTQSSPAHVGLLHHPALLTSPEERTSPIIRGAHLLKYYLCEELGTPPADAVAARKDEVGDIDDMSNRDRVTTLTDSQLCLGCHANINQTGFTFEGFDQLGAPRDREDVLDASGNVTATWPIDTTGETLVSGDTVQSFANSGELASAMADSDLARGCIAQRMFEYYRESRASKDDACTLSLPQALTQDDSVQSILVTLLANDDIFWRKEP